MVAGPDCAGLDCVGSDTVGPDCCTGPDRACTELMAAAAAAVSLEVFARPPPTRGIVGWGGGGATVEASACLSSGSPLDV
jgi:hypothetical protein